MSKQEVETIEAKIFDSTIKWQDRYGELCLKYAELVGIIRALRKSVEEVESKGRNSIDVSTIRLIFGSVMGI